MAAGVTKASLKLADWLKQAAPDSLRHWFNHDPEKWNEFRKRYFVEADAKPEAGSRSSTPPGKASPLSTTTPSR
jgi:uncharacterized protein YeaO (DUF488 family)